MDWTGWRRALGLPIVASLLLVGGGVLVVLALLWRESGDSPGQDDTTAVAEPSAQTTPTLTEPPTSESTSTTEPIPNRLYVQAGAEAGTDGRSPDRPLPSPQAAIDIANDGDTVIVGPGEYPGLTIDGRTGLRLEAAEPGTAVFTTGTYEDGISAVLIRDSSGIEVSGIVATASLWGVTIERSSDVSLTDSTIHDIGQEAVAVRLNSTNVVIRGNTITDTGNRPGIHEPSGYAFSSFGEGIYLGTGGVLEDGSVDAPNHIVIIDNEISFTTAEAIDVKPSVHDVEIRGNLIHDIDTATSGAVVVGIGTRLYPDPAVVIESNLIWNVTTTTPWSDANAIRVSAPAVVRHNISWNTEHSGIFVDKDLMSSDAGTVLVDGNVIADARYEPLRVLSDPAGVPVVLGDNAFGDDGERLLGWVDGSDPFAAAVELRRRLTSGTSPTDLLAEGTPN